MFDDYKGSNEPGFRNFEYGDDAAESANWDLADEIEQFVRENPGFTRHELARRLDTTPEKIASALASVEGPPPTTAKQLRRDKDGHWIWVYGWYFPEDARGYTEHTSERLGQILGNIRNLANRVNLIEHYVEDPHVYLEGAFKGKLARAVDALRQLDALRSSINEIEVAEAGDEDDVRLEDIL